MIKWSVSEASYAGPLEQLAVAKLLSRSRGERGAYEEKTFAERGRVPRRPAGPGPSAVGPGTGSPGPRGPGPAAI